MRHAIAGNRLSRNSSLRKATVRDIAKATLIKQRICTTEAKAKEARKLVDQLITLGKNGRLSDRRRAFAILCDHQLVSNLFTKTSSRFKNRVGGYTRIIHLGRRRGDNASLVFLELTEKEQIVVSKPRSTATAKKEKLKAQLPKVQEERTQVQEKTAPPPVEEPVKGTREPEKAPPPPRKDTVKEKTPKVLPPPQEKTKPKKTFVNGLRRIFNRKSPGGNK